MLADMTSKKFKRNMNIFNEITANDASYIKQQAYLQLAQFGLNLASSKERTLTSAIAESAKQPLAAMGALGAQAAKDKKDIQKAVALQSMQDVSAIEKEVIAGDVRTRGAIAVEAAKLPPAVKLTQYWPSLDSGQQALVLKFLGKGPDALKKGIENIYKDGTKDTTQKLNAIAGLQMIDNEMNHVNTLFGNNWEIMDSYRMKKLGMEGDDKEDVKNINEYVNTKRKQGIEPVFNLTGDDMQGPYIFNDKSLKMKDPGAEDMFIRPSKFKPSLIVK
jgi:hypothetical protein